ncbi:hypothetical protein VN97_g12471 [Penicillium thymicola]|uniref:Uncharacterized protein n=1 Tax=Penicillium thymicola TaxID=293382 RepID=A0AAI9T6B2_PENTH|nr:hypothetical protein VN97_g12471 [Penicillium thymicola]
MQVYKYLLPPISFSFLSPPSHLFFSLGLHLLPFKVSLCTFHFSRAHLAPSTMVTFHHGHLPPWTFHLGHASGPSIMTPIHHDLLPWTHLTWTCHLFYASGHTPSTMVTFHHDPIHHGPSILVMHLDLPS